MTGDKSGPTENGHAGVARGRPLGRRLLPGRLHGRVASLLGIAVALSAAPAAASPPPRRPGLTTLPPWSRTIGHPPPRPLAPAGGAHTLQAGGRSSPHAGEAEKKTHPAPPGADAIEQSPAQPATPVSPQATSGGRPTMAPPHAPRPETGERLFPRAIAKPGLARSMRAHPSGRRATGPGLAAESSVEGSTPSPTSSGSEVSAEATRSPAQNPPSPKDSSSVPGTLLAEALAAAGTSSLGDSHGERYTVRPGDSLWDIAEMKLGTGEARRVARYWPRIHRANRDVIGADPNLIMPGQVLTLPPERP